MQTEFQVGAIASVDGIKGVVKVFPTTDEPDKFNKLKKVVLKTEKEKQDISHRERLEELVDKQTRELQDLGESTRGSHMAKGS